MAATLKVNGSDLTAMNHPATPFDPAQFFGMASDLLFKPGIWPVAVVAHFNGSAFTLQKSAMAYDPDGDVTSVTYAPVSGSKAFTLTVWND